MSALAAGPLRGWDTEPVQALPTAAGELRILQAGEDGYRFYLNGQLVTELEGYSVEVSTWMPPGSEARYLLVDVATGGGSCPNRYRLLDLHPGGQAHWSDPFGTCSGSPTLRMDANSVTINFPRFDDEPAEVWRYDPASRSLRQRSGDFFPEP